MPPVRLRFDRAELVALFQLGWPAVLANVGFMLMGVVDTMMVGRWAPEALAGIALGNTWSFLWIIFGRGIASGADPLLTQAVGARDEDAFHRALAHGVVLLMWVGVPIVLLHGLAAGGLTLLGQPVEAIPLAQSYAWAVAPSALLLLLEALFRHGLQARGNMRGPMIVVVIGNVVNVPLNALLLLGVGDWPGLGPVGVGIATLLVRTAMFAVMMCIAWSDICGAWRARGTVTAAGVGALAAIAVPVGVQIGLEVWGFNIGTLVAGLFGKDAVSAHAVTLNLASLAFMVPLGLSMAASTRVGNALGAGQDWGAAAWTSIVAGATCTLAAAALFWTIPGPLVSAYLPDAPVAAALATTLLPLAAGFQLFDGTQAVAFGVLRGAGDTRVPSIANVFGYYVVGLPLGYVLAWYGGLGVRGIWVAYLVALACVSVVLLARVVQVARMGGFRQRLE